MAHCEVQTLQKLYDPVSVSEILLCLCDSYPVRNQHPLFHLTLVSCDRLLSGTIVPYTPETSG